MLDENINNKKYWDVSNSINSVDIRLNTKNKSQVFESFNEIKKFVFDELKMPNSIILKTSGSTSCNNQNKYGKFVLLTKQSILNSAKEVVSHVQITNEDIILGNLSTFHVGGLGLFARSYISKCKLVLTKWEYWDKSGNNFIELINKNKITICSLTPIHLYDLMINNIKSPKSLRGVFLGGGKIDVNIIDKAKNLGWNFWTTYGMTEFSSQIATCKEGDPIWLDILPHIKIGELIKFKNFKNNQFKAKSNSLFSGYLFYENNKWNIDKNLDKDGYFLTGDTCQINNNKIKFIKRNDDLVKILGELVSLSEITQKINYYNIRGIVIAYSDSRNENQLILFSEKNSPLNKSILEKWNKNCFPPERINKIIEIPNFPLTDIGKIDINKLKSYI